jgi:hypothetical protein
MAGEASGMKGLGSSGVLYNERRDFYIRPNVVKELWTDVAPFLTVVANQGTISGMADPTFKMFEHRNPWQKQCFSINDSSISDAVIEAGGTQTTEFVGVDGFVGIADGAHLVGLQVEIWNEAETTKKGVALVTEYTSSTIKLKNVSGANTMAQANITIADNDKLYVIGNAQGEGGLSPEAWSDDLEVVYNSCQIFKTPVQVTGTLLQASLRGESKELARLRDIKSSEHKIQKERAFLFGSNPQGMGHASGGAFANIEDITDKDGRVTRTTMGIIPALERYGNDGSGADPYSQNVFAKADVADYSKFVDAMEKVFQYVPTVGMKRAFVGAGALGYWSKMSSDSGTFSGDSGWAVNLGDMKRDALGFNYRVLETPHGMIQLVPTPALRGPYSKHMLIVDESNLFHAQYRKPAFQASIQPNDADYVKDQYFSDEGIGVSMIESHALIDLN